MLPSPLLMSPVNMRKYRVFPPEDSKGCIRRFFIRPYICSSESHEQNSHFHSHGQTGIFQQLVLYTIKSISFKERWGSRLQIRGPSWTYFGLWLSFSWLYGKRGALASQSISPELDPGLENATSPLGSVESKFGALETDRPGGRKERWESSFILEN